MKIHPNDKAAQIRQMRKAIKHLQNHQKNPAVMDALARGALEAARVRIDELEEIVEQLVSCHDDKSCPAVQAALCLLQKDAPQPGANLRLRR